MAAPSSALEAFVMVSCSARSSRLTVDRNGVCNFVSIMGSDVRMFSMCLSLSFSGLCVVF